MENVWNAWVELLVFLSRGQRICVSKWEKWTHEGSSLNYIITLLNVREKSGLRDNFLPCQTGCFKMLNERRYWTFKGLLWIQIDYFQCKFRPLFVEMYLCLTLTLRLQSHLTLMQAQWKIGWMLFSVGQKAYRYDPISTIKEIVHP